VCVCVCNFLTLHTGYFPYSPINIQLNYPFTACPFNTYSTTP